MCADYQVTLNAIGVIHSPYKQKFAIPRQPGLVTAAKGSVELLLDGNQQDYLRDIEQHSHLWLIFAFHATQDNGYKALVKAPRLGGNKKTGVFATRATHRPNPIGMSVVKLDKVSKMNGRYHLFISGLDLLDKTPILDIKPYIPYSDSILEARSDMAHAPQAHDINVSFSEQAEKELLPHQRKYTDLKRFIKQVIEQDPRPAYKKNNTDSQEYGMSLYDLNIRWQIKDNQCLVLSITI